MAKRSLAVAAGRWTEVEARTALEAWKRSGSTLEEFARRHESIFAIEGAMQSIVSDVVIDEQRMGRLALHEGTPPRLGEVEN